MTSRLRKLALRVVLASGVLLVVAAGALVALGWRSFGARAEGARLERMTRSPQWKDGQFVNPQPLVNDYWGMLGGLFDVSPHAAPDGPLPVVAPDPRMFETPPESGLRVTWLGHSTLLVEIDGHRVLTDPSWSERASPFGWIGPKRWYAPPLPLDALPELDAVLISHDHYDHLDRSTIEQLAAQEDVPFVVPLGIGAHLEAWGVPPRRIVELDWWEEARFGGLKVVCTPARHASGRFLAQDRTLWASYAIVGPERRAFFSGDTGLFPAMAEIGQQLGPFDVTMIEVGQYHSTWPDWHIGPEQAVEAHGMLRGKALLPMHWGLLTLAYHGWTEPIERILVAAERAGARVIAPKPGAAIEPSIEAPIERWWPDAAWQTAEQHPIVSSQVR